MGQRNLGALRHQILTERGHGRIANLRHLRKAIVSDLKYPPGWHRFSHPNSVNSTERKGKMSASSRAAIIADALTEPDQTRPRLQRSYLPAAAFSE